MQINEKKHIDIIKNSINTLFYYICGTNKLINNTIYFSVNDRKFALFF